jgi:hypothetical protein
MLGKIMEIYTLRELFNLAEKRYVKSFDLEQISAHINESGFVDHWGLKLENEKVQIFNIKHFNFDYRRYWEMNAVYFEDLPVMITQNAGREGDDFKKRFIIDSERFYMMCNYIHSLLLRDKSDELHVYPLDEKDEQFTKFYGDHLDGYFERF